MKNRLPYALMAVLSVFVLPLLLSPAPDPRRSAGTQKEAEQGVSASANDFRSEETEAEKSVDASLLLTVLTTEGTEKMTMAEYLPLAIAGEMPAAFETEALRAQAVALRTYVLRQRTYPKAAHPTADVCTDSGCCAAFGDAEMMRVRWGSDYSTYMRRLEAAAADTDGQYLSYDGAPVLAVFHASSSGSTENGAELGVALPYLISVTSPETAETVSSLRSTVEVSSEDLRATLLEAFPEAVMEGDPAGWLGTVHLNAAGRVDWVMLGGVPVTGLALRRLFSLRSTDFYLSWENGDFVFRVSGYGHGVGMSQHGANLMAKEGRTYGEILAHYYPGTELTGGQ